MLQTNLKHLETPDETTKAITENKQVMVCCGRMGPMCIPVYNTMENLEEKYSNVVFYDQDFDGPAASYIQQLPECSSFMGLPFTVYFLDGKVVNATTSIQSKEQIVKILDQEFGKE